MHDSPDSFLRGGLGGLGTRLRPLRITQKKPRKPGPTSPSPPTPHLTMQGCTATGFLFLGEENFLFTHSIQIVCISIGLPSLLSLLQSPTVSHCSISFLRISKGHHSLPSHRSLLQSQTVSHSVLYQWTYTRMEENSGRQRRLEETKETGETMETNGLTQE